MARTPPHLRDGSAAERRAEQHLRRQGLRLVARNVRSPFGEIDLVMHHGQVIVFVEVRYRRHTGFGDPVETVDRRKQGRLRASAEHYLRQLADGDRPCRFDVVTLSGDPKNGTIAWYQNAF
jgi:putative endonuclease